MLPDRVSNPEPLTYESGALPIALRGPAGGLIIWILVWQGPIALAVGAGGGCLDIFSLICHFSFLSPSLWKTAQYRLKYCLKGPLSPKQPTNQLYANAPSSSFLYVYVCECMRLSQHLQLRIFCI